MCQICQVSQAPLQLADPNLGCQWALLVGANGCTLVTGTMGWCLWCSNALWYCKANRNHRMCLTDVSAFQRATPFAKVKSRQICQASANQSYDMQCKTKSKIQYFYVFLIFFKCILAFLSPKERVVVGKRTVNPEHVMCLIPATDMVTLNFDLWTPPDCVIRASWSTALFHGSQHCNWQRTTTWGTTRLDSAWPKMHEVRVWIHILVNHD